MAKQRILVVDDEDLMREYVEEAMLRQGHSVDAVSSAAEALVAAAANGYDLDWCRLSQVVDRSDGGKFITKSQLPNRFRR